MNANKVAYFVHVALADGMKYSDVNPEDKDCEVVYDMKDTPYGTERYYRDYMIPGAESEEDALDIFHSNIPVALLETFDFSVDTSISKQ